MILSRPCRRTPGREGTGRTISGIALNQATTYLHAGLKNSVTQGAQNGTLSATRTYDAFGNVTASTGTWRGPFGYAGAFGYQEDQTGLRLLGHRYYDSSTGRFLTRDPIKDGRNWYGYGAGETAPTNGVDPDGLIVWKIVGVAVILYCLYEVGKDAGDMIDDAREDAHDRLEQPIDEDTSLGGGIEPHLERLKEFAHEQAVDHYIEGPIDEIDDTVKVGRKLGEKIWEWVTQ